ncbi:hypothetical protein [Nostoc sp. TCL26-01]|uniref:hypothetical protein n=1 Tax=Nostoc sp. TCL26-01 TaxID=2576904 RepID=UPI0015BA7A75|nr:hypothetical protein [Nostoc sp. TCL26-01]
MMLTKITVIYTVLSVSPRAFLAIASNLSHTIWHHLPKCQNLDHKKGRFPPAPG